MATNSSGKIIFRALLVWILIICLAGFQQNKYILRFERAEIIFYNSKIVNEFRVRVFKYNRTTTAMNLSVDIKTDLGYGVVVAVEAFKLASNEYRPFPITLNRNACAVSEEDEFGLGLQPCGHMLTCPVKKGNYSVCNWMPDYTKFPPLIPSGSYAFELTYKYFSTNIAVLKAYCSIQYPLRRSN